MTWFPGGISESFRSKKLLVVRHLVTSSANSSSIQKGHSQARNRVFLFLGHVPSVPPLCQP